MLDHCATFVMCPKYPERAADNITMGCPINLNTTEAKGGVP